MKSDTDTVKATILVDNNANDGLVSEHGFSIWIEAAGRRLLFDTGQGPALLENAGKCGVDLHTTDILILSHGHYDHTGGVPLVIERAPDVRVCYHPSARNVRYGVRYGHGKPIGMFEATRAALDSVPSERVWSAMRSFEVVPGIGITGPIPRHTDYEDTGGPFFMDPEAKAIDPIDDDLAMWIQTPMGLVVVVGCSHSGLINTLGYVQHQSGIDRIHAIIGGFHLLEAKPARVECTLDVLAALNPDWLIPCHCTGERVVEKLKGRLGDCVTPGSAGATFTFGVSGLNDRGGVP